MSGFFEIGIYFPKTEENIGTLWRSAFQLGSSGIFTIGHRYKQQNSDTPKSYRSIPLRNYESFLDFKKNIPYGAQIIGVEMGGGILSEFKHPKQAIYLLGAEDYGLPSEIIEQCQSIVSLEAVRKFSYNVAVVGSVIMYDRVFGKK